MVRAVLAEALLAVHHAAQFQHVVARTVVDGNAWAQQRQPRQPGQVGLGKGVEAAVAGGEDSGIEQRRVAVAVQEPVLHRALQRQVAHAVGKQVGAIAVGARGAQQWLEVGEERHQVHARQAGHVLIVPIVAVEHGETDDLAQ